METGQSLLVQGQSGLHSQSLSQKINTQSHTHVLTYTYMHMYTLTRTSTHTNTQLSTPIQNVLQPKFFSSNIQGPKQTEKHMALKHMAMNYYEVRNALNPTCI